MELADLLIINKADDDLEALASRSAAEYRSALRLLHPRSLDWKVQVQTCSARDGIGIAAAWDTVVQHRELLESSGELNSRRAGQARHWMWSDVNENLVTILQSDGDVQRQIPSIEEDVSAGRIPPTVAAARLLDIFLKRLGDRG
jgi:LAO/AO transport system kinase